MKHQERAAGVTVDGIPGVMRQSPRNAVSTLLMIYDGVRSLCAHCIVENGGEVKFIQPTNPMDLTMRPCSEFEQ